MAWTFLSHHAHLLIALDSAEHKTIDQIATEIGVTSRSVAKLLNDLVAGGYVQKTKVGRQNHYAIHRDAPLRHQTSAHKNVGDLLKALGSIGG